MTAPDLIALARAALEDEKRGTPGEWTLVSLPEDYAAAVMAGEGPPVAMPFGRAFADARRVVDSRTREPLLAQGYLDAVAEVEVQTERAEIAERRIDGFIIKRDEKIRLRDEKIRLRMKVWTDPEGKRWLVAGAMATRLGGPMKAYALRDAETKLIDLTPDQWNAMPYSVFEEVETNVPSPGVRNQDIVEL